MEWQNMNVDVPRRMASGGIRAGKISDGLGYYCKIDETRLQIMIKDVNEQLQSSVKRSYSFLLEICPMLLSTSLSFTVIFLNSAEKPNLYFSLKLSANLV
ncbi:hypothetical protein ACFX2I_004702 [Malus domestica]